MMKLMVSLKLESFLVGLLTQQILMIQMHEVNDVTAGVIRSFGDFLIAGNLVERATDGSVIRALPGVVRTSDIAAPGSIPQNWNPFATAVNTADEFVIAADGVVKDFVELQGNMYIYSTSSISVVSRSGNPQVPFSVRPVTTAYGALTTDSVIEFDGKHFVVGSQDIYLFAGHPGSITSIAENKVRDFFYSNLNVIDIEQVFVFRYQQQDEIWICYPSQTAISGRADEALIWNYRNQTWTKRDIQNAFSGNIGPVPGGGLPSTNLDIVGDPVASDPGAGVPHVISLANTLDPIPMMGAGTQYKETISFEEMPLAEVGGNPTIRVVLNDDFWSGTDPTLRFVMRAYDLDGGLLANVNFYLPAGLGNDPGNGQIVYASSDWKSQVVNPITSALYDQPLVADGTFGIFPVFDEGFENVSFDVEFNLAMLGVDNISPVISILDEIIITSEEDLILDDRPETDAGLPDNSIDRNSEELMDDNFPADGKVFAFEFKDIIDDLDQYVFFFKGEQVSSIDGHFIYDPVTSFPPPVETQVDVGGVLVTVLEPQDPVAISDLKAYWGPVEAGQTTEEDGGSYGGDEVSEAMDGDRRVNVDWSQRQEVTQILTGSYIKELLANEDFTGLTELDLYFEGTGIEDIGEINMIAYKIPAKSDGVPDYDYSVVSVGLLHLQFFEAEFNKQDNYWVKGKALEPISVILAYNATGTITQNEVFNRNLINSIHSTNLFTVNSNTSETTTIWSVNNAAYILETTVENLVDSDTGEEITSIDGLQTLIDPGEYAFTNDGIGRQVIAPCISLSYTDPSGIDFFSFETELVEMRRTTGNLNDPLEAAAQVSVINEAIQAAAPGQWLFDAVAKTWTSLAIEYDEADGDAGVPYPGSDDYYSFPAQRTGSAFEVLELTPVDSATTPEFSVMTEGEYPEPTTGSYFVMLLSNNKSYLFNFPEEDVSAAVQLQPQILRRIPELQVNLSGDNSISIEPAVIGENSLFVVEAYFNSQEDIEDFRRLIDSSNYVQDETNPQVVLPLPDEVLGPLAEGFPYVEGGPMVESSSISTHFDVDRTWSESQVDFSVEFPIFAAGRSFPDGTSSNKVLAAEIGYSIPDFTGGPNLGYSSFVERKQMALSPEFDTEQLQSIALWTDGSTPIQFLGEDRFNVLQLSASTTNNPGQATDLSNSQFTNTHYVSEDYKMDTRLTGRFLNWRLSDEVDGELESPGGKNIQPAN